MEMTQESVYAFCFVNINHTHLYCWVITEKFYCLKMKTMWSLKLKNSKHQNCNSKNTGAVSHNSCVERMVERLEDF